MLLIICCLSAAALAQTPTAPPRYAQLDYIKMEPGKNAEYVANERKYYKPLWQAAVDAGAMRGWSVCGVACSRARYRPDAIRSCLRNCKPIEMPTQDYFIL